MMSAKRCHLKRQQRGMVSLEFALLLPIYLLLLLAMIEAYQFFRTVSIIDRTAYSLGNLVAEKAALADNNSGTDANDVGIFWIIAPQLATPLDLKANGSVIITVLKDAGNARAVPAWQRRPGDWPQQDPSRISAKQPLPDGFPFYAGDNTVVVEVFYHFNPFNAARTFWPDAPSDITLYRRAYFRPRFQNLDTLQTQQAP